MKTKLASIAIIASLLSATVSAAPEGAADPGNGKQGVNKQYLGLGVGSTAGALVAGPAGLIVGGLIGSVVGWNQQQQHEPTPVLSEAEVTVVPAVGNPPLADSEKTDPLSEGQGQQLASVDSELPDSALPDTTGELQEHSRKLAGILTGGMGVDVFFKSGSVEVDPYFEARLTAIAELAEAMPELRVHLDGYSDRRGSADENLELSRTRLDAVREKLIEAGIAHQRIDIRALGEKQFISAPGDLEAYTFDRRVVVRFVRDAAQGTSPLAAVDPAHAL